MKHKWNGKIRDKLKIVGCLKCDCVKELIGSKITYFMHNNLTYKAPPCEGKKQT